MKLVVASGVFLLCLLVLVIGTLLPDTTEASVFNFLARTAEDSKRAAILNSPEVQELDTENTRLHEELRAAIAACPSHPPTIKERIAGLLPW